MNRNWYLPFISLALFLFAFSACDDKPEDTLSSLTIKSNYETLYDNSEDFFSFSVTGNDDVDYTSEATFYVNSSAITGSTYSTTTAGTYTVYAQYNDIQSNSITVEVFSSIINIQSMTIASNVTECVINDEAFIFSVSGLQFDGTTLNLTNREGLKIFVDSALINGNSFTPTEEKNYTVHATFNDTISSNSITVTGLPNPNIYVHKVLIEDFTGTWCQWCPRVSHSIELVHRRTENVVVAALHRGASAGSQYDPFNLADAGALESALGVIGYPTAFINRSTAWTSPENNNVSQPIDMIKEGSAYGIAISSELTTTSGTIDVSITFNKDLSNAKVVVYVMEDNLLYDQVNATSFYSGNPIRSFVHNDVVRKVASERILGDAIPAAQSVAGNEYTVQYSPSSYTASNVNNLKVLVMLLDGDGRVVNAQVAPANTVQDYVLK